jgi:hypothetical protein
MPKRVDTLLFCTVRYAEEEYVPTRKEKKTAFGGAGHMILTLTPAMVDGWVGGPSRHVSPTHFCFYTRGKHAYYNY